MDTRPTTDRIKETLFNMLNTQIPGCTFLDLFSGSGAIGIEALSRGAKQVFFVESNPEAVSCIRENLSRTHLEEGALVLSCDVIPGLKKLEGRKQLPKLRSWRLEHKHLWNDMEHKCKKELLQDHQTYQIRMTLRYT